MGTISTRRRKDGSQGYTAQIRLKRDGKVIHSESETFDTRPLAKAWMARREAELSAQRARGQPAGKRVTMGDLVAWYETRERPEEPWGRSKKADLKRLKTGALKDRMVDTITRGDFVAYIDARRNAGAGPATAANDLIWFRGVLKAAAAVLEIPVPLQELDLAAEYLRRERTIAKPNSRERRLKAEEEAILLPYLDERRGPIPMGDIYRFALLSARREAEITRLLWSDLDRAHSTALLRDVKHPRKKIGNHKTFRLLQEAWEIIDRQPRKVVLGPKGEKSLDPRIFPFNEKSVSAAFTRAVAVLGIEDLDFHDARHEATSRLFERGYSIQEVAQFTLHESWATLKRYTHLQPKDVPERARPSHR
ncbi:site-specific integrase [Lysobacter enzymogenes]|uniref:site-specific integrase n=1 Tax=Lysobacter enzymogenes TaxID=69 RepID=UPI00099CBC14|nr:site-specific integrase [Lysobacter enzymogenes]UZW61545.1 site-specific integrase [Lysobacter enzymogenes]